MNNRDAKTLERIYNSLQQQVTSLVGLSEKLAETLVKVSDKTISLQQQIEELKKRI